MLSLHALRLRSQQLPRVSLLTDSSPKDRVDPPCASLFSQDEVVSFVDRAWMEGSIPNPSKSETRLSTLGRGVLGILEVFERAVSFSFPSGIIDGRRREDEVQSVIVIHVG